MGWSVALTWSVELLLAIWLDDGNLIWLLIKRGIQPLSVLVPAKFCVFLWTVCLTMLIFVFLF